MGNFENKKIEFFQFKEQLDEKEFMLGQNKAKAKELEQAEAILKEFTNNSIGQIFDEPKIPLFIITGIKIVIFSVR